MYTKESLLPLNESYNHQHTLTDKDVITANIYKHAVENSRSRMGRPQCGDILMIEGKAAHIELIEDDGKLSICKNAYTPFIRARISDSTTSISTSTSGGPWEGIEPSRVRDTKEKREKLFCFFGSCGPTANGAVEFKALVNVFELID